ncbi:DUF4129 domain-containing protein [Fimbriiglobus ruber]|uniref:Protein-glutamine gamma-glutamyltransferase-like C-terminal domain-containing protein n=1 Tax=Fimbriiglobus ruber TaxID=1908690 RepID=A0A225E9L3_9BACT|nr:DUF4129 domain-containing protein [Fimbriiglobus ruber]OWK46736.1 hypothetical protein FRUB_00435 [Fimbriiglobus ruber]
MASDRESTPLIDIVALAISPALIMLMVGSLVFFLIEVLYEGQYSGRLLWTMFFFVFGAVLIARLSIQESRKYAALYAGGLGLACFVAMMQFVEYPNKTLTMIGPVINLGLMALVWWVSDRLTWDCTHFDEDRRASGRGVLSAAGLETAEAEKDETDEGAADETTKKKKGKKRKATDEGFLGWTDRFKAYQKAQNKKPHTPGVWVLYFALGALPLFALGQSLTDPSDADRRQATFFQMAVYIASALGLLVTTTLFGLKRYLEQRNARIPTPMTVAWLVLGGGLIVAFVAVGAILPRPHSETPLVNLSRAGQKDRDASRHAVLRDNNAGKGEGAAGEKTEAGKGQNAAKNGEKGGQSGEKGGGGGKGKQQGGDQKGDSQGKQSGEKSQGEKSQGEKSQGEKSQGEKSQGEKSQGEKSQSQQDRGKQSKSERQDSQNKDQRDGSKARDAEEKKSDSDDSSKSGQSASQRIGEMMESVGQFLKWVVWTVIAIAVIAGIIIFVLNYLAPFTTWARGLLDWLRGLFARKKRPVREGGDEAVAPTGPKRPPPFAVFDNPFADGSARHREVSELVEYTFTAFDSWAWDRDIGRQPEETPMEFAVRVGHEHLDLDEPAFQVVNLYVRVLYSRSPLPKDATRSLKSLWEQLESAPRPVAAAT